jgi:endonuclease/exonuclease/phosphatase family metal-dependent hydrolase
VFFTVERRSHSAAAALCRCSGAEQRGMTHLRVATYNIHKGVQGLGPNRRLEIHNLGHAVEQFDADIVCLQEVRKLNRGEAAFFQRWPEQSQAEYLAPEGYNVVYRSNAITRDGEHGNAVLSRWPVLAHQHEDMSDHRFEQRGLLHAEVEVDGHSVHVVVVHLGLIRASRVRQLAQLAQFIAREIPGAAPLLVAGDFNDWGALLSRPLATVGLRSSSATQTPTFPSRLPLVQFDHMYVRGLTPVAQHVPRGRIWWRMSDHLPLIAEFELSDQSSLGATLRDD